MCFGMIESEGGGEFMDWVGFALQMVMIILTILLFVGLYMFVKRIILHTIRTREDLKRMETKLDSLLAERKEHGAKP